MDKRNTEIKKKKELRFEEIFKQNERRIHYHIQRLGIRDSNREFYSEGLFAMWVAYKKYQPNKGPLATYFNYNIRNRLIDMLRKNAREQEKDEIFIEIEKQLSNQQYGELRNDIMKSSHFTIDNSDLWQEVKALLTEKQWNWVYYHIILEMPLKDIAEMKGVSVESVKSWGKEARKKLRVCYEGGLPLG